jgi:transposase InsO family protein
MKEWLSAIELSKLLGISGRAVTKRANKENWKFKISHNRGKSGGARLYNFQSFSREVQKKIITHELGCNPDFIASKNVDFSHTEALLKKWSRGSDFNRKVAQARDYILKRLSQFVEEKRLAQGNGEERFASFYNTGLIKGVDPWVLDKISTISGPTLRRWRSAKEKNGLPGLLGEYGTRKGQQKAVSPEQSAFIISHIKAKPHIRSEHVFKMVCKTFKTHPSRRTIYRFIENWKQKNTELFALIEDPRRWKNKHMSAFGSASANVPHFGYRWEMDSSPADIITKDGKRLTIIGAIDVYSRRAILLIAPTSKSLAIAACVRKAMISWGISSCIVMDNGPDYKSIHVGAITSAFNIDTPELPKYSPEKKPHIERFFGTVARGFEELLPGYVGHSVAERKALQAKETWAEKIMKKGGAVEVPLTMEEFQTLTDRWNEIYEQTPHAGLGGKTPLEVARSSTLQPEKIRDLRILDILLAPVGRRTVQKKGISIDGEFFISPELIEYINIKVEIRRDLSNAGLLYVFDAFTGKYLCQAKNEPLEGQRLEEYRQAKKEHLKNLKGRVRALESIGLSNRTPIQILLEDGAEHNESKVIPFQGNFENEAVKEAQKAVADTPIEQIDEVQQISKKAVNYYHSMDHLIDNSWLTPEDIQRDSEALKRRVNRRFV